MPFITAGDPDLETTIQLVPELEAAGAHIVELGIPFSDPVADGPVIQRSSERALRHGYKLADHPEAVKEMRRRSGIAAARNAWLRKKTRLGRVFSSGAIGCYFFTS